MVDLPGKFQYQHPKAQSEAPQVNSKKSISKFSKNKLYKRVDLKAILQKIFDIKV